MCRIKNFRIYIIIIQKKVWTECLLGWVSSCMNSDGCLLKNVLNHGSVCGLQAGLALLNNPCSPCLPAGSALPWGAGNYCARLCGTPWVRRRPAGSINSPSCKCKGWRTSAVKFHHLSTWGGEKANFEPRSSYLWAAIYCLYFQNFVPDLIVVGNCLLVNFLQCECKCCSNSHVAYSWTCTNRWGSYIKSIFDNLMGFAKAELSFKF